MIQHASVIDGQLVVVDADGTADRLLAPGQIAARFGVHPTSPAQYAARYPAEHVTPWPGHVPGQWVRVDGDRVHVRRVRQSAVDAWMLKVRGRVPVAGREGAA